jgi:hypothetical protein
LILQITVLPTRNQKWLIALSFVLLGGMLLFVLFEKPPALPKVMVLPPRPFTMPDGDIPFRWIPAEWTQVRRLCRYAFKEPQQIIFDINCPDVTNTPASIIARNSLGKPLAETNGWAVWIISPWTFNHFLYAPGSRSFHAMQTAHYTRNRMKSTLMLGWGGDIRADFFPRLKKDGDDLLICLMAPTHFDIALRVQLHHDDTLFLMDVRQPELVTNRTEIEIRVREEPVVLTLAKGLTKIVTGNIKSNTGLVKMTLGSPATNVTGHEAISLNATNGGGAFQTNTNAQAFKQGP